MPTMPTKKKRINISLSEDLELVIKALAKRDNVPEATKAVELIKIGIEVDEDEIWNELAEERAKNGKYISHEEAWS